MLPHVVCVCAVQLLAPLHSVLCSTCPEQVYAPPQSSTAAAAPLPQLLDAVTHELAHVPEHVVVVYPHALAPLHPLYCMFCPEQVYAPVHVVLPPVVPVGACPQLPTPVLQ